MLLKIVLLQIPRGWFLTTPHPEITWKFPKTRDTLNVITCVSTKWLKMTHCNLLPKKIIYKIWINVFLREKPDLLKKIRCVTREEELFKTRVRCFQDSSPSHLILAWNSSFSSLVAQYTVPHATTSPYSAAWGTVFSSWYCGRPRQTLEIFIYIYILNEYAMIKYIIFQQRPVIFHLLKYK